MRNQLFHEASNKCGGSSEGSLAGSGDIGLIHRSRGRDYHTEMIQGRQNLQGWGGTVWMTGKSRASILHPSRRQAQDSFIRKEGCVLERSSGHWADEKMLV